MRKTETHATTLMARLLDSSGLRSEIASSSSTSTSTTSSALPTALISRERVAKSDTGKYKERGTGNSDPKNMTPCDRIEEFPGKNLCLRGGNCFAMGVKRY